MCDNDLNLMDIKRLDGRIEFSALIECELIDIDFMQYEYKLHKPT